MSRAELAILGGSPVISGPFRPYPSIGEAEVEAVTAVMRSGSISAFYGSWGDQFLGGPLVRRFEEAWADRFGSAHAVSVNSATSGLIAALGAVGVGPGDEVIVPPYTMSATVMAPLFYGGLPVFVDIEPATFCIDPARVAEAITPRTRAIVAVNLFGHPAALAELRSLADQRGIYLIEDNAQSPLASEHGRAAGTVGHIGVFSLNYHKHIHTGEGGMCVTDDAQLAQRLQLIRNHGENAVEALGIEAIENLIGFNFRMTELGAAIGLAQLDRIDEHVGRREAIAHRLNAAVEGLEGLTAPLARPGCRHVYYLWGLRFDAAAVGVDRQRFSMALAAEGFPNFLGYLRPLYRLPVFQRRVALGRNGFPFTLTGARYDHVDCPVVERMWSEELICFETCAFDMDESDADRLGEAVRKVHAARQTLATRSGAEAVLRDELASPHVGGRQR